MLREYQSEIEKLKQMIEKGGFEGGEVVPSEVTNKKIKFDFAQNAKRLLKICNKEL